MRMNLVLSILMIPALATAAVPPAFPPLKAENLNGVIMNMPSEFEGEVNLLLIAFLQKQQADVDTWLKPLPAIAKAHPNLRYYELPTIKGMNRMVRWFINNGMRGGIPDKEQRARTITLYIDKEQFKKSLGLGSEDQIYAVLIDKSGKVIWNEAGLDSETKGKSLEAALAR